MAILLFAIGAVYVVAGAVVFLVSWIPAEPFRPGAGMVLAVGIFTAGFMLLGVVAILDHLRRADRRLRQLLLQELAHRLQRLYNAG